MTKVTIDRELLERVAQYTPSIDRQEDRARAISELRSILESAPRQPEAEGLEVVAYECLSGLHVSLSYEPFGDDPVPLWRAPDAQRVITELREERDTLRKERDAIAKSQRYGQDAVAISAERDTLRQQRDKLKRLLIRATLDISDADLLKRIDAALAEVNP